MARLKTKPIAKTVQLDWNGLRLIPLTPFDREQLDEVPRGSIEVEIFTSKRSLPHQRYYRAMIGEVAKSLPTVTVDTLHQIVKMECGYVDVVRLPDGTVFAVPKSTAFDTMDEVEFRKFTNDAIAFISERFGINPDDLHAHAKSKITNPERKAA